MPEDRGKDGVERDHCSGVNVIQWGPPRPMSGIVGAKESGGKSNEPGWHLSSGPAGDWIL
jgi:hypothetical protein